MQAKLGSLNEGDVFEVRTERDAKGNVIRRFFFNDRGVRVKPPESGSTLALLGPEVPELDRLWKFRLSNWMIYPLLGDNTNRVHDIAAVSDQFRLTCFPQF